METLCVLLEKRSSRAAVEAALQRSREGAAGTLVLSACHSSPWMSEPLAAFAGAHPVDPCILAAAEVGRAAGRSRPLTSMWIADRTKVLSIVKSLLGEHEFHSVIIGSRQPRDPLRLSLFEETRRYKAAEVFAI